MIGVDSANLILAAARRAGRTITMASKFRCDSDVSRARWLLAIDRTRSQGHTTEAHTMTAKVDAPAERLSTGQRVVALVLLALLGLGGWLIVGELRAGSRFRAAVTAIDNHDVKNARQLLDQVLRKWPDSGEVHFFAARAARLEGAYRVARDHLSDASKYGWVEEAIDVERSLLQFLNGESSQKAESYLIHCLNMNHPDSHWIAEVLTPVYYANFRLAEANDCAEKWVEHAPKSAKGWALLGDIRERSLKKEAAVQAYRTAHGLSPNDAKIEFNLARLIIDAKMEPGEASDHLDKLRELQPDDVDVATVWAACRIVQGRSDMAIPVLDETIRKHPHAAQAMFHRAQIDLEAGKPELALPLLRNAFAVTPYDAEILYSMFRCLNQLGQSEEAARLKQKWEQSEADLKLLSEITNEMITKPHDPDLRFKAGEICLRNGLNKQGIDWLESALRDNPNHPAANKRLFDHFTKLGQLDRANYYRKKI